MTTQLPVLVLKWRNLSLDELTQKFLDLHKNLSAIPPEIRTFILDWIFEELHPTKAGYQHKKDFDKYVAYILRYGHPFLLGSQRALSASNVLMLLNNRPQIYSVLVDCAPNRDTLRKVFEVNSELPEPAQKSINIGSRFFEDEKTIRNRSEEFIKLIASTLYMRLATELHVETTEVAIRKPITSLMLPKKRTLMEHFHDLGQRVAGSPLETLWGERYKEFIRRRDGLFRYVQWVDKIPEKPLWFVGTTALVLACVTDSLPHVLGVALIPLSIGGIASSVFLLRGMQLHVWATAELDCLERAANTNGD